MTDKITLEWANLIRKRLEEVDPCELVLWKQQPLVIEFITPILKYASEQESRITEGLKPKAEKGVLLCSPTPTGTNMLYDGEINDSQAHKEVVERNNKTLTKGQEYNKKCTCTKLDICDYCLRAYHEDMKHIN